MISREDAVNRLGDDLEVLANCVQRAWSHWHQRCAATISLPTRRARANVVHDLIIAQVRKEFDESPRARVVDAGGRSLLSYGGDLVLRFKKLRPGFRTSNYPTQLALAFDHQLPLRGIPTGVRLTLGYVVDRLETGLAGIHLVCARGERLQWSHEIAGEAGGQLIALPGNAAAPVAPSGRIRRRETGTESEKSARRNNTD